MSSTDISSPPDIVPITTLTNASQCFRPKLVPTTTKTGVPRVFHEPHVETGFRQTGQPWIYYVCSLFQRHNECMNCWTHLLALIVVLRRIWYFSQEFDMVHDPYMWPLGAGMLTTILLYIFSSGAHCFSNKYVCYIVVL